MKSVEQLIQLGKVKLDQESANRTESLAEVCDFFELNLTELSTTLDFFLEADLESAAIYQSSTGSAILDLYNITIHCLKPIRDYCQEMLPVGLSRRYECSREARLNFPNISAAEYQRLAAIYNQTASLYYKNNLATCRQAANPEDYATFMYYCHRKAAWHQLRAYYHSLARSASADKKQLADHRKQLKKQAKELQELDRKIDSLPKATTNAQALVVPHSGLAKQTYGWKVRGLKYTPLKPKGLRG